MREFSRYPERKIEKKVQEAASSVERRSGEIGSAVGRDVAQATVKSVASEVLDKHNKRSA